MFGFLKNKLKGALNKFSKEVEEEVKEKAPEIKEIPEEERRVEEPKAEKKKFVKICPKCGSIDVKEELDNAGKVKFGAPLDNICQSCGFRGKVFPEIEEDKVKEFKKEIEEKKKEEKVKEKPKIEEKKEEPKEIKKEEKIEEKKEESKTEGPKEESRPEIKKQEPKTKEKAPEQTPEKKKGFFKKITEKVAKTVTTTSISEKKFDELFWDLELALLENNAAVEVIDKIKADLRKELTEKPVVRGKIQDRVVMSLKKSISELFDVEQINLLEKVKTKKPFVICFVGVNGSGKTTSIAKVAHMLKQKRLSVILAAADTFRAAAIDQLQLHADNLGVKLIKHDYGSDAAAVAFDAVKHAEAKAKDVVLIDTAGRLHSDHNLVEEMKKIVRVSKPDMVVFVGESITGNDCIEQAQRFNQAVSLDGIILSKADIDEKGGAAISVSYVTKKPILYIGTGQEYKDLELFDKEKLLASIGL